MSFEGKVVVVTGGASGMGAACVREFAAQGARVVVVDRNAAGAADVAESVSGLALGGDVSQSAFCNEAIAAVVQRYGRLDVLVNAAGIIKRTDAIHTADEAWRQIFGVNVDGIFFMCRAALPHMVATAQRRDRQLRLDLGRYRRGRRGGLLRHQGGRPQPDARHGAGSCSVTGSASWRSVPARWIRRCWLLSGRHRPRVPFWMTWPTARSPWGGWRSPKRSHAWSSSLLRMPRHI